MQRYMKHLPTNTIHIFDSGWMNADNHGFVECDEGGRILNDPIEGEATVITEPKKSHHKAKPVVNDEALSAESSRGL